MEKKQYNNLRRSFIQSSYERTETKKGALESLERPETEIQSNLRKVRKRYQHENLEGKTEKTKTRHFVLGHLGYRRKSQNDETKELKFIEEVSSTYPLFKVTTRYKLFEIRREFTTTMNLIQFFFQES